ncbi:hypothetical protein STEG23_026007, partial [Scotinomys teguina]
TREDEVIEKIMKRCFILTLITTISWADFHFVGHEIWITGAKDGYGAVIWPLV